ncbi:MAG: FAD-dependent oxidoreductase [Deltaproteobacteria bacterium]|nr:MAG: FAD-dependent oxidoreductase [Deltaproteobacteria bacterium]
MSKKAKQLKRLMEPVQIGNVRVKNRLWMAPTCTKRPTAHGLVSQKVLEHYESVARGGVGCIIVEAAACHPEHLGFPHILRIDNNDCNAGLRELTSLIHFHGAKCSQQILAGGLFSTRKPYSLAPSEISAPGLGGDMYKAKPMTNEQIEELVDAFADACLRAKTCGYDMAEIHGATGYAVEQFYSSTFNRRTDHWGGSFENRIRFPLEILRRAKKKCGPDFPIGFRILGMDGFPDGWDIDEAIPLAQRLEAEGAAYISVTALTYSTFPIGEGYFCPRSPKNKENRSLPYCKQITEAISIPTMANGNLVDPIVMEELLEEGYSHFVGLARPILADPDLPRKAFRGDFDDIRTCIRCSHCLWEFIHHFPVTCAINPELGREREYEITPVRESKKVLVVGGGPGGLEAARVAALRGHQVTLMEKDKRLGGQLWLAASVPGKGAFRVNTIGWLSRQCEKAGVDIQLNTEVTLEKVREFNPDVIIAASGATPGVMPEIPGIEDKKVYCSYDILSGKVKLPKEAKNVIVEPGWRDGIEMAEILAQRGHSVTVVDPKATQWFEMGYDMNFFGSMYTMQRLLALRVRLVFQKRINEITDEGAKLIDNHFHVSEIEADAIVMAHGRKANSSLPDELEAAGYAVYRIGDCLAPREIANAIHDAAYVARQF